MSEECLICGKRLVYLDAPETMRCAICGEEHRSRARCEDGHYICDECHTTGAAPAVLSCADIDLLDPIEILDRLMDMPGIYMHGPEHHMLVPASLVTAYRNNGGEIDMAAALREVIERGAEIPGGVCGYWGACGAGIGAGVFVSIVTGSDPLEVDSWGMANEATSRALAAIGAIGGPRCCKRDSYTSVIEAAKFASERLGVRIETHHPTCRRCGQNEQCIRLRCPYNPANTMKR